MKTLLRSALFLVIAELVLSVVAGGSAEATTVLNNPFGNAAVWAAVGKNTQAPVTVIVWQRRSDGACQGAAVGGQTGLSDDYVVFGGSGNDVMGIVGTRPTLPVELCGYFLTNPAYNGHFLDFVGEGGDDSLSSWNGDTWLSGKDGNDNLFFAGSGHLIGGNGNDSLISSSSVFGAEGLFGEGGSDCLEDRNAAVGTFDCGPGTDRFSSAWGSFPMSNCETPYPGGC